MVVWNITAQCNLKCLHCYADFKKALAPEFTTAQAIKVIDDLKSARVPVIIFSGGEPLLRKDIFSLSHYALQQGIRVSLSTNGTLINCKVAGKIKQAGINYVGISIDGMSASQDFFRQKKGTFKKNISAIKHCQDFGIKTGIRFTVSGHNLKELNDVLSLAKRLKVDRFCLYHLVYAGRGRDLISRDLSPLQRREVVTTLSEFTRRLNGKMEVLTVDSPCDGIYLNRELSLSDLGDSYTGCSAGKLLFNIDAWGFVHPCQFWQDYDLGNLRKESFNQILLKSDPLLLKLSQKQNFLKGKCGLCRYRSLCGGCRVRAKVYYGNSWQEDPSCFLIEKEIKDDQKISHLSSAQVA